MGGLAANKSRITPDNDCNNSRWQERLGEGISMDAKKENTGGDDATELKKIVAPVPVDHRMN